MNKSAKIMDEITVALASDNMTVPSRTDGIHTSSMDISIEENKGGKPNRFRVVVIQFFCEQAKNI